MLVISFGPVRCNWLGFLARAYQSSVAMATPKHQQVDSLFLDGIAEEVDSYISAFAKFEVDFPTDKRAEFKVNKRVDSAYYVEVRVIVYSMVAPDRILFKTTFFVFNPEGCYNFEKYLESLKIFFQPR